MNILRDVSEGIHPIGGYKRGEMVIYSGGRGVYYSVPGYPKTSASLNRLMSKYKFSRKCHVADFVWEHQAEVLEWCSQQFGPHPKNPDAWCRWHQRPWGQIHFRDERDYVLFLLRWS
jgi:hypothetical protein